MYDSRSDHPHKGVHWMRDWREMGEGDRIEWGTPKARVLATATYKRQAIAEGLADMGEEVLYEAPGLKQLGLISWSNRWATSHTGDMLDRFFEEEDERAKTTRMTNPFTMPTRYARSL